MLFHLWVLSARSPALLPLLPSFKGLNWSIDCSASPLISSQQNIDLRPYFYLQLVVCMLVCSSGWVTNTPASASIYNLSRNSREFPLFISLTILPELNLLYRGNILWIGKLCFSPWELPIHRVRVTFCLNIIDELKMGHDDADAYV